jgi:lactosylceramide 4-alpha-galactosyltransferase
VIQSSVIVHFHHIDIMFIRILSSNIIRKRLFAILVGFVIVLIVYINLNTSNVVCYFDQTFKDGKTLKNVQENLRLKSHDSPKNIFFHETSCTKDGIVRLTSRQGCAIESSGKCWV